MHASASSDSPQAHEHKKPLSPLTLLNPFDGKTRQATRVRISSEFQQTYPTLFTAEGPDIPEDRFHYHFQGSPLEALKIQGAYESDDFVNPLLEQPPDHRLCLPQTLLYYADHLLQQQLLDLPSSNTLLPRWGTASARLCKGHPFRIQVSMPLLSFKVDSNSSQQHIFPIHACIHYTAEEIQPATADQTAQFRFLPRLTVSGEDREQIAALLEGRFSDADIQALLQRQLSFYELYIEKPLSDVDIPDLETLYTSVKNHPDLDPHEKGCYLISLYTLIKCREELIAHLKYQVYMKGANAKLIDTFKKNMCSLFNTHAFETRKFHEKYTQIAKHFNRLLAQNDRLHLHFSFRENGQSLDRSKLLSDFLITEIKQAKNFKDLQELFERYFLSNVLIREDKSEIRKALTQSLQTLIQNCADSAALIALWYHYKDAKYKKIPNAFKELMVDWREGRTISGAKEKVGKITYSPSRTDANLRKIMKERLILLIRKELQEDAQKSGIESKNIFQEPRLHWWASRKFLVAMVCLGIAASTAIGVMSAGLGAIPMLPFIKVFAGLVSGWLGLSAGGSLSLMATSLGSGIIAGLGTALASGLGWLAKRILSFTKQASLPSSLVSPSNASTSTGLFTPRRPPFSPTAAAQTPPPPATPQIPRRDTADVLRLWGAPTTLRRVHSAPTLTPPEEGSP